MKSLFLHLLSLILPLAGFAQTPNILDGRTRIDAATLQNLNNRYPSNQHSRMLGNIILDYDSADAEDAFKRGGLYSRYIWDLNSYYTDDDTNRFGLKWAVVRFDTLVDMSTGTAIHFPRTNAGLVLDSLKIAFTHENTAGTPDTIQVSIYERNPIIEYRPLVVNGEGDILNTVLWDTLIITTTSLTAGASTLGILTVYPQLVLNYPNNRFIAGVHFYGDTAANTFTLLAGYKDLCNNQCFASPSVIENNSLYHLIEEQIDISGFPGLPYDYHCSSGSNICEEFPIENFVIQAFITMENHFATVTGSVFIDADSNCVANTSDTKPSGYNVQVVGAANHKTTTDLAGNYKIFFTTPGNYELQVVTSPPFTAVCADSGILSISIPTLDSLYPGYDFALRDTTQEPIDTIDTTTGLLHLQHSVLVYPNPFTDHLTIESPSTKHQSEFGIYDLQGKLLRNYVIPVNGKLHLTGLHLEKGMYFYRIETQKVTLAAGKLVR